MSTVTPITEARDEYDDQFAALCAAFDRGYTADRRAALRAAFVGKLSAAQVARTVERLIGESGPEKMPTVREIWQAYRSLRAAAPARKVERVVEHTWPPWHAAANVILIGCAQRHPGRESRAGWELARRLGADFQLLADDGDAQPYDALKATMLAEYARLPMQAAP